MTPDAKRRLWTALAIVFPVNFVAFLVGYAVFGGDAVTGYAANGHYYLYSKFGGAYTEVSRALYAYSWWHAASLGPSALVSVIGVRVGRRQRDGASGTGE